MQPKQKPCKSTKTKGFGCGKLGYYSLTKGLCFECYPKWLYGTDEGRIEVSKALSNARKQNARKAKKELKEAKEKAKLIDPSYYRKKLQEEVQKISRLIDYGNKCLARDTYARQMHGGHVLSRGAFPSACFNLHNIFIQSAQSNHFGADDALMREGIIRGFGLEYLEFNNSLKQCPTLKYTSEEYKDLYAKARQITLELKADCKVRTPEERIEVRNKYNLTLGIYEEKFAVFKK